MSNALINRVYHCGADATARYVLLVLADRVNIKREGKGCWYSVRALREMTGLGERTIQGALKRLEDQGHITIKRRSGTSSVYLVHPQDPRKNCGGKSRVEPFETPNETPAATAPLPRKSCTTTPAATAPKSESITNETQQPAPFRRAQARSIGQLLRSSSNPSIRKASG